MRYPFYKQYDAKDCGVACLRMICKYHGKILTQRELWEKCFTTKVGTTLLSLSSTADALGFKTAGERMTYNDLVATTNKENPFIALWNKNHFVVVYKCTATKVIVGDPAEGIITYSKDEFIKYWTISSPNEKGIVLLFQITDNFEISKKGVKEESGVSSMLKYLKPHTKSLSKFGITILIGSLISIAFPYLTSSMVDNGIADKQINIIILILVAQLCLTVGSFVNKYLGTWILLHTSSKLSITLVNDFIKKLMKLPISFFDKRIIGDLLMRIDDFDRIEKFLTATIVSSIMAVIGFIVYSGILFSYGKLILVIFIVGTILYICWICTFMKKRSKLDYIRFQELANNQSNVLQLIYGMQEIKLNNCEEKKRREWDDVQNKLYKIKIQGLSLSQAQNIGGLFIDQLKNIFISFIAARSVVYGEISLGAMMAIQYIVGQMNTPMYQFIGFITDFQDMKISANRINEVYLRQDEELEAANQIKNIPQSGDIEISNLEFHYNGPRSAAVINNISCTIQGGQITAVVGASGSGKSTLIRLLLGFYTPSGGQIKLGNYPLQAYNIQQWRNNCGAVMQEGYIFTNTILYNVALIDDTPDKDRVIAACKAACIADFIESLPLGYDTIIGVDGVTISTGQKQRIMIARAIYKNSSYIFLDEATNALDVNNEHTIIQNLNKFYIGRTVVIVAHRLSTVRNADKIIVLNNGMIAEQGTHTELISKKGAYYQLIHDQLTLDV